MFPDHDPELVRLEARVEHLEQELYLQAMKLAAVSVAAQANTPFSAKTSRLPDGSPYWTPAYSDVVRAVDREMHQRKRAENSGRMREMLAHYLGAHVQCPICWANLGHTDSCPAVLLLKEIP